MKKNQKLLTSLLVILALAIGGFMYSQKDSERQTDHQEKSPVEKESLKDSTAFAEYIKETMLEITQGEEVYVKKSGTEEYQMVSETTVLHEGDSVKVGENSEAYIYWMDDSRSILNSNTEIVIMELQMNEEDPTDTDIQFNITVGEVWSKAMNIVNDEATFSIKSGDVVVGIRGTTVNVDNRDEVIIQAIDHAIYLLGLGIDIPEGEEATVEKNEGETDASDVSVSPIADEFYQSDWFGYCDEEDHKYEENVRAKMLERIQNQVDTMDSAELPVREDLQTLQAQIENVLQLALLNLNKAVLAFSQNNNEEGTQLLQSYEGHIAAIQKLLSDIDNEGFVKKVRLKIAANNAILLKYSHLLMPDNDDMTGMMENVILNQITDKERKQKIEELFKTRRFFNATDRLRDASQEDIEELLKRYESLFAQFEQNGFKPYECKVLVGLKKKLEDYNVELPALFDCQTGEVDQASPTSGTQQNRNPNQNNTPSNPLPETKPDGTLLIQLQNTISSLTCLDSNAAQKLQGVLSQKNNLTSEQAVFLQQKINALKQRCRLDIEGRIAEKRRQLANLQSQPTTVTDPHTTGEVGIQPNNQEQINRLSNEIDQLQSLLNMWR